MLAQTPDQGEAYLRDIIFIGDSRTYGYQYYGVLPDGTATGQVWCPANHTFNLAAHSYAKIVYEDGTEKTLTEALQAKHPKVVIIELGINSVSYMTEKKFKTTYGELIDNIKTTSPETRIICNSIYCVCRSYKKQDLINNTLIYQTNKWLLELAYEKGVKYLDAVSVLRDSEGYLPEDYQSGDGLHLKKSTYYILLDYIRTHAYL